MKKIFLWIVWGMFLCQGCDRFLDIQPKGYTIPSKYDDYRQLMNYAQMAKATPSLKMKMISIKGEQGL